MSEETTQRPPLHSLCPLRNGIDSGSICSQACDNAFKTWMKGNMLYKCEFYKEAIEAYDKAYETWPWIRSLRRKPQTAQSPSLDYPSIRLSNPAKNG